jgi:hypothetical protein
MKEEESEDEGECIAVVKMNMCYEMKCINEWYI